MDLLRPLMSAGWILVIVQLFQSPVNSYIYCHCSSCPEENFKCRSETFCYSQLRRARPLERLTTTTNTTNPEIIEKFEQIFYSEDYGCIEAKPVGNRMSSKRGYSDCLETLNQETFNASLRKYALLDTGVDLPAILRCCRDNYCNKPAKLRYEFDKEQLRRDGPELLDSRKAGNSSNDDRYVNWYTLGAMSLSILISAVILLQLGILCGRKLSIRKVAIDQMNRLTDQDNKTCDGNPQKRSLNITSNDGHMLMAKSHPQHQNGVITNCPATICSDDIKANLMYPTISCRSCDSSKRTGSDCQANQSSICRNSEQDSLDRTPLGTAISTSICQQMNQTNHHGQLSVNDQQADLLVMHSSSSAKCPRKLIMAPNYPGDFILNKCSMTPGGPFTRTQQPTVHGPQIHSAVINFGRLHKDSSSLKNLMPTTKQANKEYCQHYAETQLNSIYQQNVYMDPNYSQTPIDRFNNSAQPIFPNQSCNTMTDSVHLQV